MDERIKINANPLIGCLVERHVTVVRALTFVAMLIGDLSKSSGVMVPVAGGCSGVTVCPPNSPPHVDVTYAPAFTKSHLLPTTLNTEQQEPFTKHTVRW
jgi:hypothetical protein